MLLKTPQDTFRQLVPWLLLAATLLLIFGGPTVQRIRRRLGHGDGDPHGVAGRGDGRAVLASINGAISAADGLRDAGAMKAIGLDNMHIMKCAEDGAGELHQWGGGGDVRAGGAGGSGWRRR
ncbi:MAG: hypothetical protein U0232_32775 [Thermomicrobiales bacterium]